MAEPNREFDEVPATVGFLDGRTQTGQIARWSPAQADMPLAVPAATKGPPPRKYLLRAEDLAYVAFSWRPTDLQTESPAKGTLRVHVASGRSFLVDPVESDTPAAIGFFARPERDSPYRKIFFYAHGVNATEENQPLGEMLVQAGHLSKGDLERTLSAQHAARIPIGQILLEHRRIDAQALQTAAELQARKRLRIGEILVEAGLAKPEDIEFALAQQRKQGGKRVGEILIEMNLVSEVDMSRTLAKKFHLPFVDLDTTLVNTQVVKELPRAFILKHQFLPLDGDGRELTVALADPLAVDALDLLRFQVKKQIREVVATRSQLATYISKALDEIESSANANEMETLLKTLSLDDSQAGAGDDSPEASDVRESDSAVIRLANQIILDAYRRGASDIHVEPNGQNRPVVVRFRVDGDCISYQDIPPTFRQPLVARIKIMAKLDISERRKPQDGKIRFNVGERQIELRVATIPTVNNNEDVVMRILAAQKPIPLDEMALSVRNLREFRALTAKPYGLILCVGPTGSGKTTTLHSALGSINTVDTKIWTAEDPVEITQAGLRQVQVHPKIGFTFAAAMRAFLRADPDVIMVGEMRDPETANTAVEASLTGHLVLSTLHTNTAPETITRLVDMGLEPFSFADALLGVLAQRLARGLCKQCRKPHTATRAEFDELVQAYGPKEFPELLISFGPNLKLFDAAGCNACMNTGYKGRIALHELLVTNDTLKHAIARKSHIDELRSLAVASGMRTLLQDGIAKVFAGMTDMKQVLAVCSR